MEPNDTVILNICVNAIHAGSTDADSEKWKVPQEIMEREIKKVRRTKKEHESESESESGRVKRRIGFSAK